MKIEKFTGKTKEEAKKKWLKRREGLITGTSMSIILGLNDHHRYPDLGEGEIEENAYMSHGKIMEPAIINAANQVLKTDFESFCTKKYPYILCIRDDMPLASTPDAITDEGLVELEKYSKDPNYNISKLDLLECKLVNKEIKSKWKVTPPAQYLCQMYCQMMTTDINTNKICGMSADCTQTSRKQYVLHGFIYELKRDPDLDKLIFDRLNLYFKDPSTFKPCFFAANMIKFKLLQNIKQVYP